MAESNITIPSDLTDALGLRRVLTAIVRELDTITGVKGVDPYVKESELPDVSPTLTSLNDKLGALSDNLALLSETVSGFDADFESLESRLNELNNVTAYEQGAVAMLDFDDTSWSALEGLYQLSDLGENFTNPPQTMTTGVTYNVYVSSGVTLGAGVVQEVILEDTTTTTVTVYKRAANSFAQAVVNGWVNV